MASRRAGQGDMDDPTADPIPRGAAGKATRVAIFGIFLILLVYALYFARDFFLPVLLSFLFALTLSPIVRVLSRRGIPSPLSATLLVLVSGGQSGWAATCSAGR
jgi:predicted PurR-regulated permease PerM